jgi:integral membrane sensor domain MASE1
MAAKFRVACHTKLLASPPTRPLLQLDLAKLTARRQLLLYAVLPLAYIVSGRLGLILAVPPGYATVIFLPAGIAVTATFVAGGTALPGIFLGSFLLNLWIGHPNLTQIAAALVIATGSMAQAAIGGTALRRTIGYRALFENDRAPFENARDFLVYLLLAPLLCLTSATISLGGLWALAAVELRDLPMNWTTWWLGDTLGVLLALPLMVVLAEYSQKDAGPTP